MPQTHESFLRYRRALTPWSHELSTEERLELLQGVVVDLLIEIDALRSTLADAAPELRKAYAARYRDAALLSHNGAGFMSPIEKVLLSFIDVDGLGEGELREEPMLRRLGLDVAAYRSAAAFVAELS